MLSSYIVVRGIISVLVATHLTFAVPGKAPQACGGNICYPVLVGPLLKDIAQDFCSYYLHYPKTTTVTVKTTSTLTKTNTLPTSTVKVTATTRETDSATVTSTTIVPAQPITSTATETITVQPKKKRTASPGWTPPKGSGDGYKPPALAPFAASVISAACSCIVTPSTTTVTSTIKATATAVQTLSHSPITTTVKTVTSITTVTVTEPATVTADPSTTTSTTIVTETATPPSTPQCSDDISAAQSGIRSRLSPQAPPPIASPLFITSPFACYQACKGATPPPGIDGPSARSYVWNADIGQCTCYEHQICSYIIPDGEGGLFAGDLAVGF